MTDALTPLTSLSKDITAPFTNANFFFYSYSCTTVLVQKKDLQLVDSSDFQLQEESIVRRQIGIFYDPNKVWMENKPMDI